MFKLCQKLVSFVTVALKNDLLTSGKSRQRGLLFIKVLGIIRLLQLNKAKTISIHKGQENAKQR